MEGKRPLLEIENLRVCFPMRRGTLFAVDGASLSVDEGETVGLVGESGCGKTMTALAITRLTPRNALVTANRLSLASIDMASLGEKELREIRGKKISYVFQDPMTYLNPVMKIFDQISEPMRIRLRKDEKEIYSEVMQLLQDVQIADKEKVSQSYPHQLSGGMKQRVLLAIALSCNPSLLIADEPTTALDVTVQAAVLELLKKLKEKYKLSVLLITHDLGIVGEVCDRVYIMYAGKVMETGTAYEIYDQPLHPYTAGLLKAVKSIVEYRGSLYSVQGAVADPLNHLPGCRFHPRCEKASSICREREPALVQVKTSREVSCWLCERN